MQAVQIVQSKPLLARFLLTFFLPLALGLLLFVLLLRPPLAEFALMLALMGVTTLVSILAAYLAYHLGWIHQSPRIRWTLLGGYVLAALLVFLNVWVSASMMFADQHDLLLATVLLVFATGIALAVGYFITEAITDRILLVARAARQVAAGDLTTRVPIYGKDEMAHLAETFNEMTAQLESLEQHKSELDNAQRDLLAWVGHDLRTPLTSIRAILEALGDDLIEDPETVRRYLHTAQRDVRSLSHLINDLFEVSQMQAGGLKLDYQPNALTDLVSDTIEGFSELARRKQIELSGSVEPGIDPVWMDGQRISQVLTNLVDNALRHTSPGGLVKLTARLMENWVQVEVQDNGEGISSQDLPLVFDRFFRADKSRSRATGAGGLGLTIADGIIKAHGGQIKVESQPGQGARFTFTLPVNPGPGPQSG